MASKPKVTDEQAEDTASSVTAAAPNVDDTATTGDTRSATINDTTATAGDNPAAQEETPENIEPWQAMAASGRPARLPIASRLLCSILQLPAYSDICRGSGDEALQEGAVTLSLIMADKLISMNDRLG